MRVNNVSVSHVYNRTNSRVNFKGDIADGVATAGGCAGCAAATGVIAGAKAAVIGGATVSASAVAAPVLGVIAVGVGLGWLLGKGIEKLTGK